MKKKIILIVVILLVIVGAIILYVMNSWGEAKSEIKELTITEVSEKIESVTGVEINDIGELQGRYTTYDVDSSTSELMFSLEAMKGTVGKFKIFEVEFIAGEEPKINVDINPGSIYTANGMRDESLLDVGFFEVNKFPTMHFESTSIELTESNYVATGMLSMLGVEKGLNIPFTYKGKSENYKGLEVAIFEGKFILDRTNYGMEHTASVGDEVSVSFTVQLEKQNE